MSLELLLMSESSLEENCRFADDVTAEENRKSERCGIDGGGEDSLLLQRRERVRTQNHATFSPNIMGFTWDELAYLESVSNGVVVRLLERLVVASEVDLELDGCVVVVVVVVVVDEEVLDVESVEEDVGLVVD